MPEKDFKWQTRASVLFCASIALVAVFLVGKYIANALLPFFIALTIALLLRPAIDFLSSKTKLSKKLCAVFLLILLFLLLGTALTLGINRLIAELYRLVDRLSGKSERIGEMLSSLFSRVGNISSRIPIIKDIVALEGLETLGQKIDETLRNLAGELVGTLTTKIPGIVSNFAAALPSFFLFFIVTVIATVYLVLDFDAVIGAIKSVLPNTILCRLSDVKVNTKQFLGKYFRAYLLILFLTFCELFVGFTILRVDYAFLLAFLIALVDILPIFGVGTVLLPWSIILFFGKNFYLGFGLLILWCAVTVVRQIIEPRIVGGTFGIHPMLTLLGMYIGFRLFGIAGMLLSPAAIVLLRFTLREYQKQLQSD